MIRNDEELAVVRTQLAGIQDALESLRRDVLPRNERNYEVLSEGYTEQIAGLQKEIHSYLEAAPVAGRQTFLENAGEGASSPDPRPASR